MHDLCRKLLLLGNHFFGWLKAEDSSTACGTSTLKSPPSRAFAAPHVHPRPQKRPPRCTLDCGFKTSESPALRGFVVERCPITGTSLYLVLKSNGLRHSKNLPVKFGFSPKTVLANTAKKLPPQRCLKPFLIPFFNFAHKWPTFAFTGESGYTLGSLRKIAHNGSHAETGAFPPPATVRLCAASEIFYSATLLYTYISRFSVNPQHQQKRNIRQSCCHKFCPKPLFIVFFNFFHKWPTFAFTSESGYTTRLRQQDRTQALTRRNRGVSDGGYHYPRYELHVHEYPRAGCQNGKLCRFWVLVGGAPKERRKPSEQRCAYARRCSEASRPRWAA